MTDQPPTDPQPADQPPTDPTPDPERHPAPPPPPVETAPPPPTLAPAPAPAPPQWSTPPPAASSPPRSKASGSPIRGGVVVIGVLALLAVIGAIVWDGGSSDTTGPVGPAAPGGPGGEVAIPGSAGSSGGGSSSGGSTASPQVTTAPINPTDLGPSGASMAPTESGVLLQWRLQGNWQDQITTYRSSFPAAGYELYRDVGGQTTNDAGQAVAIFYEVVPIGAEYYDSVGYLEFQPDPDDPAASTYLMWRTSL